jgi:hypothetical protein
MARRGAAVVRVAAPDATAYCIVGALFAVADPEMGTNWSVFEGPLRQTGVAIPLDRWNDAPERTVEEVVALLLMTAERLEREGDRVCLGPGSRPVLKAIRR